MLGNVQKERIFFTITWFGEDTGIIRDQQGSHSSVRPGNGVPALTGQPEETQISSLDSPFLLLLHESFK